MFDNKTLLIEGLLVPLSFMVILFIEFGWSKKQAVRSNLLANLFHFSAYVLFLSNGSVRDIFSFGFSRTFIFLSAIFILITTFKLFSLKVSIKTFVVIGLITFLIINIFSFFINSRSARLFIIYVGVGVLYLYGILNLIISTSKKDRGLLTVFIIEFLVISITSFSRFIFFSSNYDLLQSNVYSAIYILISTLFILLWNYTVQLKRNLIFQNTIEKNSEEIYKIQEDLSILNNNYFERCTDCSLEDLYHNIFELIHKRFLIKKAALYVFGNNRLNPVHTMGLSDSDIDVINGLTGDIDIVENAYSKMIIHEIYAGNLEDSNFKSLIINNGLIGAVSFPLYTDGSRIGSMFVGISPRSTIINRDRDIFYSICRQISGVIFSAQIHNKLLDSQKKLKEMASTDHLTGIHNRREFLIQFRGEFNSAIRHSETFILFMLDIDNFRDLNETYGHDVGDQVLITVANVIKNQLRGNDLFARFGSQEFVGVLLKSEEDGALIKLNNIINDVSNIKIKTYSDLRVSLSIGGCRFKAEYENIEAMIKYVNLALSNAKSKGENQLCIK